MSVTETSECPFCAIARGANQAPEIVCGGDSWVAFFPLEPATPGHTLVIPREHTPDLWKVRPELAADLMRAVLRVGSAIETALRPEGLNLITSAGEAASQTVFHLHLHVIPRWHRDGFRPIWPSGGRYEDATLDGVADRVREACRH